MRALIVDDDEPSCQLLTKILQRVGIDAEWSTDSVASYAKALQHHYDVFVLDVRMPGLTGIDFAAGVRQVQPHTKIVLISAFPDEELQKFARALHATLLAKPFNLDRLLAATTDVERPLVGVATRG